MARINPVKSPSLRAGAQSDRSASKGLHGNCPLPANNKGEVCTLQGGESDRSGGICSGIRFIRSERKPFLFSCPAGFSATHTARGANIYDAMLIVRSGAKRSPTEVSSAHLSATHSPASDER